MTEFNFTINGPDDITWQGKVDGDQTDGTIIFYEGHDEDTMHAVFYTSSGDYIADVETGSDGFGLLSIVQEDTAAVNCVCWPPKANGTCTNGNPDCDVSANCGAAGGICTYRNLAVVTM